jgi:general secretion pathway protein I
VSARESAGFTLVEMLVALALLSIVALALIQFQTFQIGATRQVAVASIAAIEADNRAVDAMLAPLPATPVTVGGSSNGGARLAWRQVISPGPVAGVARIDITVGPIGGSAVATRTLWKAA